MKGSALRVAFYAVAVAVLAGAIVLTGAMSDAAKKAKIEIGQEMPDFAMKDLSGKEHKLSDFKGEKAVVLVFTSQDCPWIIGADESINQLAKDLKDNGKEAVVLAIDADKNTTTENVKQYVEEHKITYPILEDENNQYADKVGANQTPEVFVVDKEGKLAYHGALDDRKAPDADPENEFARTAVEQVLAGQPVETTEKPAYGCTIKRVAKAG